MALGTNTRKRIYQIELLKEESSTDETKKIIYEKIKNKLMIYYEVLDIKYFQNNLKIFAELYLTNPKSLKKEIIVKYGLSERSLKTFEASTDKIVIKLLQQCEKEKEEKKSTYYTTKW